MLRGELLNVGHTVRDLTANRVLEVKARIPDHTATERVDELVEACQRLGSLGEECYRTREVDLLDVLRGLHDDGLPFGLSDEAVDLGVPLLAVDDYLSPDRM